MKLSYRQSRFVLRRKSEFKYVHDKLFLAAVIAFAANRFVIEPLMIGRTSLFHCYFNDLICFPFWLPVILLITRKVRLRDNDAPPCFCELCFYLLIWSFIFEYVAPLCGGYLNHAVADPLDIVCYTIGCVFSGLYWSFRVELMRSKLSTPSPCQNSKHNMPTHAGT